MGGRGSSFYKAVKTLNRIPQTQQEIYEQIPIEKLAFITDLETQLKDNVFYSLKAEGISVRESTDKLERRSFSIKQMKVLELSQKYRKLLKERSSDIQLAAEDIKDHRISGYTYASFEKGVNIRLVLDSKTVNNSEWERLRIKDAIERNWHVPIDFKQNASKYIITHEMGHVIEDCIFAKLKRNSSITKTTEQMAIDIKNEVVQILKKDYANYWHSDRINLSDYSAESNSKEWFAETFTHLHLSSEPLPIGLALRDYLERYN